MPWLRRHDSFIILDRLLLVIRCSQNLLEICLHIFVIYFSLGCHSRSVASHLVYAAYILRDKGDVGSIDALHNIRSQYSRRRQTRITDRKRC